LAVLKPLGICQIRSSGVAGVQELQNLSVFLRFELRLSRHHAVRINLIV
jgi:hypothetical protein